MMKKRTRMPPSTPLSVHKDSQIISKAKPKIRIIHLFAPQIIKTDVASFRQLVQTLTGKLPQEKGSKDQKMELRTGLLAGLETIERVKEEDEGMWGNTGENSGGFLTGFGDLDGFIQEYLNFLWTLVISCMDFMNLNLHRLILYFVCAKGRGRDCLSQQYYFIFYWLVNTNECLDH
ncbi:hypothetical protein ERO13_D09G123966v2 [Gossypium hirsutum]|uniref:VQ motif-containing protein 17 n=1 Tax=Gossypium hirsutum TaxID=3635 RepID=A0ABM3AP81_GOSHI|nr:VQ motif-containing protein 17-like [Gossypium hirsutum]KAG4130133.1 hypothetical protein ERO13_D09G123966v2 [Gossypium hirsutum]